MIIQPDLIVLNFGGGFTYDKSKFQSPKKFTM